MKGTEDDGESTTGQVRPQPPLLRTLYICPAPHMLAVRSDWRTPQCQADKVQGSYKDCQ
jgi:hypothetical protein